MEKTESASLSLRWPEIYSLAALSAAVAISWIAYHEYQPHLLVMFGLQELSLFLILSKGIILVIIPPIAGWLADLILRRTGKFFMVFSVGIGITAMVFMGVATIISAGTISKITFLLPYMIVLWLIAMNIFTSPALSMIESFAPTKKLPLVVGFLFFITQLIYALEPLVVQLVQFFGDTLTFVVGGVLIASTGYVFQRVSSDEVITRRKTMLDQPSNQIPMTDLLKIVAVGIVLGIGNGFLVEYVPFKVESAFSEVTGFGGYISFGFLGFAALVAYVTGGYVSRVGFKKVLIQSIIGILISASLLMLSNSFVLFIIAGLLLAFSFGLVNVSGLPYAISKLSVRHITFGIGAFIGASYVFEGILEYMYK